MLSLIQSNKLLELPTDIEVVSKTVAELSNISKRTLSSHHIAIHALCELCKKV